jgi:hypothetical protein
VKVEPVSSKKGDLSICGFAEGEKVLTVSDFLDLMGSCQAETIVLRREDLAESFFDLRSRFAGELLQKVSNYRRRLVLLGEYPEAEGRALGDFIRESNRTGRVVFAPDLERAVELLK